MIFLVDWNQLSLSYKRYPDWRLGKDQIFNIPSCPVAKCRTGSICSPNHQSDHNDGINRKSSNCNIPRFVKNEQKSTV
ncbi:MAG TPA: hypothetical protein DCS30_18685 [Rhizobiales bacterium]|nr:hypothetical protein [Hyphomicrobiales bacterium]